MIAKKSSYLLEAKDRRVYNRVTKRFCNLEEADIENCLSSDASYFEDILSWHNSLLETATIAALRKTARNFLDLEPKIMLVTLEVNYGSI